MSEEVSVLIVDDSALMRNLLGRIIEKIPGLRVADRAMNGRIALEKIPLCNPDIILLDLEMPEMNGIAFLQERKRRNIDIPVVVFSSIASEGAKVTMECLSLGACDFITKPGATQSTDLQELGEQLKEILTAYGRKRNFPSPAVTRTPPKVHTAPVVEQTRKAAVLTDRIDVIAIGISTGGPNALRKVFSEINGDLKIPILVVQHMPPGFTREFAESLNKICPLSVKEAQEGDLIQPGRVLIAPGNYHIEVEKKPLASVVHLSSEPQCNGHRPSADVLFESVAKVYKSNVLGVIMTGMGKDGAKGLGDIVNNGGISLGQDESSSVVYGMPKAAYEMGYVMKQVNLDNMAEAIYKYALSPRAITEN